MALHRITRRIEVMMAVMVVVVVVLCCIVLHVYRMHHRSRVV
jgi:Tfp pilus assembly protein PilV